jgi:AcrR family transcriptional regulator
MLPKSNIYLLLNGNIKIMSTKQPEKDKEQTKQRLIDAVGVLLREKGFRHVKVNEVAAEADVSKILIYRYFGGLEGLIDAYIKQKDFWITYDFPNDLKGELKNEIKKMYHRQIESMRGDEAFKELHLKELADKQPLSQEVETIREKNGLHLIQKVAEITRRPEGEVAALASVLGGAITYLSLFERMSGGYNGINLHSENGWEQLSKGIDIIIDSWFSNYID